MIDKEIINDMPREEVALFHVIDKAIGEKELNISHTTPAIAARVLFNALKRAEFKEAIENEKFIGYKVSRMELYGGTEPILGEETDSLINWFQRKNGYEAGFIIFPTKQVKGPEEEKAPVETKKEIKHIKGPEEEKTEIKKEEKKGLKIGFLEISADVVKEMEEGATRGATAYQINYVSDMIEKIGLESDMFSNFVKGTKTILYTMAVNFAKELEKGSKKSPEGILDKSDIVSEVATENMYNGMRMTIRKIRDIFNEEKDKDKAAERVKNEVDLEERCRAEWEHQKREEDVNTVVKGLIIRRIFKEKKGQDEKLELIIEDNRLREVFGYSEIKKEYTAMPTVKEQIYKSLNEKTDEKPREIKRKEPERKKQGSKVGYILAGLGFLTAIYGLTKIEPFKKHYDNLVSIVSQKEAQKYMINEINEDISILKYGGNEIINDVASWMVKFNSKYLSRDSKEKK